MSDTVDITEQEEKVVNALNELESHIYELRGYLNEMEGQVQEINNQIDLSSNMSELELESELDNIAGMASDLEYDLQVETPTFLDIVRDQMEELKDLAESDDE